MSDSYGASSGPGSQPSASAAGASSPTGADPSREFYRFENGWTMQREGSGGLWHLRRDDALLIGRDQYRNDLINRHALEVAFHFDPAASAIEARRGETQSGSIGDESAAPKADAQPQEPTP